MTKKRFKTSPTDYFNFTIIDTETGEKHGFASTICDLLNELHEENEMRKEHQRTLEAKIVRLKDKVKTFEKHYSLKDIEIMVEWLEGLHEENEQLRKENKSLKDANEGLVGTIAHFELEDL